MRAREIVSIVMAASLWMLAQNGYPQEATSEVKGLNLTQKLDILLKK